MVGNQPPGSAWGGAGRRKAGVIAPALQQHAAGDFDSLSIDPAVVIGEQGRDHATDVVGLADPAQGGLPGDHGV